VDALGKHMEVVDDTQLPRHRQEGAELRPAAKLGLRIDIKSEEEKRQEVESQMAAVEPAPVSVLVDHGLTEAMVEIWRAAEHRRKSGFDDAGRSEALPGIDPETVEAIQTAVNSYYGQFESEPGLATDEQQGRVPS
jgi:N utilization substance protein A